MAANLADVVWRQSVLDEKKPVVSEPYLDPATGESIISVVSPVFMPYFKNNGGGSCAHKNHIRMYRM